MTEAKKHQPKEKVGTVWATVLGVEIDEIEITRAVIDLQELAKDVRILTRNIDGLNHELYLASFNTIEKAFFPLNLHAQWSQVVGKITPDSLTRLEFCAEELSKHYSEETIDTEELAEITNVVDTLSEKIGESSLPLTLRLVFIEEIENIRHSIRMYHVGGAKHVKKALQGTLGAVVANHTELKTHSDDNAEVLKKMGELIDKLDVFTARAMKLHRILKSPIGYALKRLTDPDASDATDVEDAEET